MRDRLITTASFLHGLTTLGFKLRDKVTRMLYCGGFDVSSIVQAIRLQCPVIFQPNQDAPGSTKVCNVVLDDWGHLFSLLLKCVYTGLFLSNLAELLAVRWATSS